jgi:hypothetical protein
LRSSPQTGASPPFDPPTSGKPLMIVEHISSLA